MSTEDYLKRFPQAELASEEHRQLRRKIWVSRPDLQLLFEDSKRRAYENPEIEAERVRKIRLTTNTEEFKDSVSQRQKAYQADPEWKAFFLSTLEGKMTPERIARYRGSMKKYLEDPEYRERMVNHCRSLDTPERRKKHSETMKAYFADPVWKANYLESLHRSPNQFEMDVLEVLKPLGFEFTGDFSFWIGIKGGINLNPDFIHRKAKVVVESLGEPWHTKEETRERKLLMATAGWTMIHVWYEEFYKDKNDILVLAKWALEKALGISYDTVYTSSSTGA